MNENALLPYLTLQYSATEETFFKGGTSCPPHTISPMKTGSWISSVIGTGEFAPKEQSFDACADELIRPCTNLWPRTALQT